MNRVSQSLYPPRHISQTLHEPLVVLQLTDLHLRTLDLEDTVSNRTNTFKKILYQALEEKPHCHLIVLTGDLINDMDSRIYDWIFQTLEATNIPFVCISGNHDVTDEVGDSLNFHDKELIAYSPDQRLVVNHVIESEFWQIFCIDSSVAGQVSGYIDAETLSWLEKKLSKNKKPALICLHHHVVPIQSKWIDDHITLNSSEFWQCLLPFKQVKVTICGHVHQESCNQHNGVINYSTPATSYQFEPNQDDFAIDKKLPGYRWLHLAKDGSHTSEVKRLNIDL